MNDNLCTSLLYDSLLKKDQKAGSAGVLGLLSLSRSG